MLVAFAQRAEVLGFDSLWVVDNYLVATPTYRVSFLDALTVLSTLASVTSKIRLGTSVLQVPLRQPVMLAKQIATMDWLSNGRFDFGIGVGGHEKEYEGAGVPMHERGARLDEYLEVMVRLWTHDEASFHGRFTNFDGIRLLPKPIQRPYPPVSFGGGSTVTPVYADDPNYHRPPMHLDRVFRRIARYGRGWQATSTSEPELIKRDWAEICRYASAIGRDPREIERMQTTYLVLSEKINEIREAYGRIAGKDFDKFVAKSSYLFGPASKIIEQLQYRSEIGIDRMILTPVDTRVEVLDVWWSEIIQPLAKYARNG